MKACQFICWVLTCWRDWLLDGTPKSFTALGFHRSCEGWKYKMPTIIIEYIRHPNSVWKTFRYCLFANAKNVLKSIGVYTVWFCWTLLYTVINTVYKSENSPDLNQLDHFNLFWAGRAATSKPSANLFNIKRFKWTLRAKYHHTDHEI